MSIFSKFLASLALAATTCAFAQSPAPKADDEPAKADAPLEVRETFLAFCKAIKAKRESAYGPKVTPHDRTERLADAAEMQRQLGLPCPGSGSSSGSGSTKAADSSNAAVLAQLRQDLDQARQALALKAGTSSATTAKGLVSATGDKLIDCETKSRIVYVGNDGQMYATCAGSNDTVFRAPPPSAPQVIVVNPAVVHQLGAPVASAQAQAAATATAAPAAVTATASASATATPGPISGRGTVRYHNPITGKVEVGNVNSAEEATAWLLERRAACTAELRKQAGIAPDANCEAPQRR